MDLINKKRTQWRNNIRRQDLDQQKEKIRKEMRNKDYRDSCINLIRDIVENSPRNILMELAEQMQDQEPLRKGVFAESVWCYLTSPCFTISKRGNIGLGNLLVQIYPYLSDHSKLHLACPTIVTSILREYYRSSLTKDTHFFNQIGRICNTLCYQTLRQSNFHINIT